MEDKITTELMISLGFEDKPKTFRKLGFNEIVEEYKKVGKWYA